MPETTYAPTDWNVHLGIYPDPNKLPPEVPDPMAQFAGQEMSLDDYERLRRLMAVTKVQQEESRAAAIRYQGQTEFQRLLNTGMESTEALRRTAPKMFYGHPTGLTSAFSHMMPPTAPVNRTIQFEGRDIPYVQTGTGVHFPPAAILKKPVSAQDIEPQEKEIPGTDLIKFWNPATGHFVVRNKTGTKSAQLKPVDLLRIAKELPDNDTRRKEIIDSVIESIPDLPDEEWEAISGGGSPAPEKTSAVQWLKGVLGIGKKEEPKAKAEPIQPPVTSTGPSPFNLSLTNPPVVAAGVTNTPNSQFVPPPAAAVPPPATNAPAGVARVDPVLGNVSPELDKMLNMSAAERRMYALTNRAPAMPTAPPTPPLPAIHTNMVPPALDNRGAVDILPLPRDKSKLIKGRMYNTKRGPALWDGENFIQE